MGDDAWEDEDPRDTETGWDTPFTMGGWGGESSSSYARDTSLDAGHDDNEETDPDQDEYEPKYKTELDWEDEDYDEDDDGKLLSLLLCFDFLFFIICKELT